MRSLMATRSPTPPAIRSPEEVVTDPKIASIKDAYAEALRRRRAGDGRPDRLPPATKPTIPGDDIAKNKT